MTNFNTSQILWRKPWQAVSPDVAPSLEKELHREMCRGHTLFGRSVTAIGRRQDCDDTLFFLGDTTPRFAVVHLTYQVETRPDWPETQLFDSYETWFEQCMIPDAEDFAS